ncbi:hypothetical protein GCM10010409_27250 [Mycolicibacterium diernhoferi]
MEGIAYTFEQLAHDRYLGLVLQPGKAGAFTARGPRSHRAGHRYRGGAGTMKHCVPPIPST